MSWSPGTRSTVMLSCFVKTYYDSFIFLLRGPKLIITRKTSSALKDQEPHDQQTFQVHVTPRFWSWMLRTTHSTQSLGLKWLFSANSSSAKFLGRSHPSGRQQRKIWVMAKCSTIITTQQWCETDGEINAKHRCNSMITHNLSQLLKAFASKSPSCAKPICGSGK